nr:SLATT domain-containing protein [uncultured Actinoplanes sp.]
MNVSAETRAKLRQIEQSISEDDLTDRALVHALVRADWYRTSMRRNRVRFVLLESGALLLAGAATVLAALSAPPWLTATVAAAVTFLAGLRRIVAWHDDWLAHAEAWTSAMALITQYRLLPVEDRTPDRRSELASAIDALTVDETRTWARRRRDKAPTTSPA